MPHEKTEVWAENVLVRATANLAGGAVLGEKIGSAVTWIIQ